MLINLTKGTRIRVDEKRGNFYRGEYELQTQDRKTICIWECNNNYLYIPIDEIEIITIFVNKED